MPPRTRTFFNVTNPAHPSLTGITKVIVTDPGDQTAMTAQCFSLGTDGWFLAQFWQPKSFERVYEFGDDPQFETLEEAIELQANLQTEAAHDLSIRLDESRKEEERLRSELAEAHARLNALRATTKTQSTKTPNMKIEHSSTSKTLSNGAEDHDKAVKTLTHILAFNDCQNLVSAEKLLPDVIEELLDQGLITLREVGVSRTPDGNRLTFTLIKNTISRTTTIVTITALHAVTP